MTLPIQTDALDIRLVSNLQEAMDASDIRNTGREFMTHDQQEIGHADQAEWFYGTYNMEHRRGNLHLFAGYIALEPAAYGLVARRKGGFWLTGVVAPEFRGQGHGYELFEHMGKFVLNGLDDVVNLDVKETNMPARKLYESLGYQYDEPRQQNGVLIMRKVRANDWAA